MSAFVKYSYIWLGRSFKIDKKQPKTCILAKKKLHNISYFTSFKRLNCTFFKKK